VTGDDLAKRKLARQTYCLVIFLILYFAFEACFVNFISLGAGLDDAELISNISFWNWGYGGSQPPLYTWIAYSLTQIFGLHFLLLQFLRFGILGSGFFAVYLGLRGLNIKPPPAIWGCLAVFLLPQISWESQRALIHSVLGTAGSAWSFAAFVWFVRRPSYGRALALGLAFTIAILGKYNGLIFVAALLASCVFLKPARRAFCSRYFSAAIISALIFMSPALIFMAWHPHGVMQRAVKFKAGDGTVLSDILHGIGGLIQASFNFSAVILVLSALLIAIIWIRQRIFPLQEAVRGETEAESDNAEIIKNAMRFIGVILLCGLGICLLIILLSGTTHVKDRWLQPVLFLLAPYMVLLLVRLDISGRAARIIGIISIIAACAVPPALYLNLYARGMKKTPVQNINYNALYDALSANGKIKTILAPDPYYAGNIRLLHPGIKTLFAETPFAEQRLARPLVLLWSEREGAALPWNLRPVLDKAGINPQNLPQPLALDIPTRHRIKSKPSERFYYIYLAK